MLTRFKPRVIAVTGSVGKTTTKDAIYAAVSPVAYVRKSEKSFNSEIGVPLTILGCENAWKNPVKWIINIVKGFALILSPRKYPEWLVLEVGADRPGDIKRTARWLRPDIAVLTGVPEIPSHIEYFDSPEAILAEKRALVESLAPGGTLILNGDDLRMKEMHSEFRSSAITYGTESYNNFFASHVENCYERGKPIGIHFRMNHLGSSIPISVYGALGLPRVYSALAAIAVGNLLELDFVSISAALAKWRPQPGRMRILSGLKGSIIIDDTYNSSPSAALSALDTMKSIECKSRRIAVLGDMLELGKWTKEAHRKVGERAAKCADLLITVGIRARDIGEAALDSGMPEGNIKEYEMNESARAGKELEFELREGDIVLIKGSQGLRMERAVFEIMAEPQKASELLVRQDAQWQAR